MSSQTLGLLCSLLVLLVAFSLESAQVLRVSPAHATDPAPLPGRWQIPTDVLASGRSQEVPYEGAGRWRGRAACEGELSAGARALAEHIAGNYPKVSDVAGYDCRHVVGDSRTMSVHGTGRAIDILIPKTKSKASNATGDPIANWLIENAQDIGVQLIIWDRTIWSPSADGDKERRYTGAHPHDDHIHVELTPAAAAKKTPWFRRSDGKAGKALLRDRWSVATTR